MPRNIFIALAQVAAQQGSCDIFHEQEALVLLEIKWY
jgi:hypothetical protein